MDSSSDHMIELLAVLKEIASGLQQQPYTITGAADWPMLAFLFGIMGFIIVAAGGLAWADIRGRIERAFEAGASGAMENKRELREHKADDAQEFKDIWENFKLCQGECCPPREGRGQHV